VSARRASRSVRAPRRAEYLVDHDNGVDDAGRPTDAGRSTPSKPRQSRYSLVLLF